MKLHIIKKLLFIFLILTAVNIVSASNGCHPEDYECGSLPVDNCDVRQDTTFDTNIYNIPNGIDICENNIVLDCNGAVLNGSKSGNGLLQGNGITLKSIQGTLIKNCYMSNYYDGIQLITNFYPIFEPSGFNSIINNTMNSNKRGIFVGYSDYTIIANNSINSNDDYGIMLFNSNNTIVANNSVNSSELTGIDVSNSNNTIVANNSVNSSFYGIHVYKSYYSTIAHNNANSNKYGIFLSRSNYTVVTDNIILSSLYWGIEIGNSKYVMVTNNNVKSNEIGIHLFTTNATVTNNNVNSNDLGISLDFSKHIMIINNTVYSNQNEGIKLIYSRYVTITNNYAASNDVGIQLYTSNYNTIITNNMVSSNSIGIELPMSNYNTTITNNTISSNTNGIQLYHSNNSIVTDNTINSNQYTGIELYHSNNNMLIYNIINSNKVGIYNRISNYTTITNNTISSNTNGIQLYHSNNTMLIDNTVNSNEYDGIKLIHSNYNTLASNNLNSNAISINLEYSDYTAIMNNNIFSDERGILILHSNNSLVKSNYIVNNSNGIELSVAYKNKIYNNFFNNTVNARDLDGINFWNITKTPEINIVGGHFLGGNFWSDYQGEDLDGDGLGDTLLPYKSDGNIINDGDYVPLTTPSIDTDVDGYSDVNEIVLGSDPNNPLSTPEYESVFGSCLDKIDNDIDGKTDFKIKKGKLSANADSGCDYNANLILDYNHQVSLNKIKLSRILAKNDKDINFKTSKPTNIRIQLSNPLKSTSDTSHGLPEGHDEIVNVDIIPKLVAPELQNCNITLVDNPRTPENESESIRTVVMVLNKKTKIKTQAVLVCPVNQPSGSYRVKAGNPGWKVQVHISHVNSPGNEFDGMDMIRTKFGDVYII